MKFTKYHALGNDYIVIDPADLTAELTSHIIRRVCDRHYGIGSDGVLLGPLPAEDCDFALRIFNPDGSEAEKSGNGLRIFSRYLWDKGLVRLDPFSIQTLGGVVQARVFDAGAQVSVEMGRVGFTHVNNQYPDISRQSILVEDKRFDYYAANVGNPHCVIPVDELNPEFARQWGPIIELDSIFTHRTNVQFLQVIDANNIQIEIWERGAGYTLASGSSSTAAAAVAFAMGWCDAKISVHMPGGIINITLQADFTATMTGPVCKIAEGIMAREEVKI